MDKLFNRYSRIFIGLTIFLFLYRHLYVVGFNTMTTGVLACAVTVLFARLFKDEVAYNRRGRKMDLATFFVILGFMFLTQFIASKLYILMEKGFNAAGLTLENAPEPVRRAVFGTESRQQSAAGLYSILIGPVVEEILYRAYAANGFEREGGRVSAALLSGIVFAIGHGRFNMTLHTFAAGILYAYVFFEFGFRWAAAFHIVNNLGLVGLDMLLCALLGTETGILAINILSVALGLVAIGICIAKREKVKAYLAENRPEKGEIGRAFANVGFIAFLAFNVYKAVNAVTPLG